MPCAELTVCRQVEFAAPVGYQEPERPASAEQQPAPEEHDMPEPTGFVPFQGSGLR